MRDWKPLCLKISEQYARRADRFNRLEDSDIFAECLIAAWKAEEGYDPDSGVDLVGYVALCVKRKAIEVARKERRDSVVMPTVDLGEVPTLEAPDRQEFIEREEELERVRNVCEETIRVATPRQLEIAEHLYKTYQRGGNMHDAAKELGISRQAVSRAVIQIGKKVQQLRFLELVDKHRKEDDND